MPVVCNNRVSKLNKIMLLKQRKKYNLPFHFHNFVSRLCSSCWIIFPKYEEMKKWLYTFQFKYLFSHEIFEWIMFFPLCFTNTSCAKTITIISRYLFENKYFCSLWLILKQKSLVKLTIFTFIDLFIMRFYCFIPMSLSCFSYGYNTSKPWY